MSSGTEEMEAELMQEAMQEVQDFRYGIAKISQGLQKFRNHRKNFAILVKFRYGHIFSMIAKNSLSQRKLLCIAKIQIFAMPAIFAMIAKFTMHREIGCPLILIQTTPFCIIPILSPM